MTNTCMLEHVLLMIIQIFKVSVILSSIWRHKQPLDVRWRVATVTSRWVVVIVVVVVIGLITRLRLIWMVELHWHA